MLSAVNYYLSEILSLLIYLVYKNGFYLYFVPRIFIQQDNREKSLLLVGLNFSVERSWQVYCTVVPNVMLINQFLIRNLSEDVSEEFKWTIQNCRPEKSCQTCSDAKIPLSILLHIKKTRYFIMLCKEKVVINAIYRLNFLI